MIYGKTDMSMTDSRYEIRVAKELKEAYLAAAKRNDRDGAQLIRDFMRDYVKQNAQQDLLTPPKRSKK